MSMKPKIKINLDDKILKDLPFCIEIGCGSKRKDSAVTTIDRVDLPHVDIVADLEEGLPFLPDSSVDAIYCRSVLEHIENFEYVLGEILRVLKPKGKAYIYVPHFSNPYFYSDFTHKRFFGLYSFYYFVDPSRQLKRKVPVFYTDIRLEILLLKLSFKSPFWFSKRVRKLFGLVVNSSVFMKEFYELHLSSLIPCDGVEVVITRPPVEENKQ